MGPNPGQQLFPLERLGDEINRAQRQAVHPPFHFACCAKEHDRHILGLHAGFQPPAHFKPVHARHTNVQEDEVRQAILDRLQRQFPLPAVLTR
jgi:hypothetical protein